MLPLSHSLRVTPKTAAAELDKHDGIIYTNTLTNGDKKDPADSAVDVMTKSVGMRKRRVFLINLLIVSLIASSLYMIVRDKEHWPFAQYAMYAAAERDWSLSVIRLVGVMTEEGDEIPLQDHRYTRPFNQSRQRVTFERLLQLPIERRSETVREALRNCLERYEVMRLAGEHNGPPLRGIRLYQFSWKRLDPAAANVYQPDDKTLIAEVLLAEAQP